ncbi:motility associated factor glycosyltransferase family protein [Thalassotalea montiporae]
MSENHESLSLLEKIAKLEERAKVIGQQINRVAQDESTLQQCADRMSLLVCDDDTLFEQFQLNMAAFKRFDPNIFEFFEKYQPTRYIVDIHEGFPNIIDLETRQYIYKYPAYLMASTQVASYQQAPQSASAMFDSNEQNEPGFIHSDSLTKILKLLADRMEKNDGATRRLSKFVNSTMIFGVGNGYHIELLSAQHNIKNLYIFEPELDVFYASLFIANWHQILSKVEHLDLNIHISLGDTEDTFFQNVLKRSDIYGRYDMAKMFGFIHYHTEKINGLVKVFKARFRETIQGWGFFDDAVMSNSHMLTSMKQGVPILKKKALLSNPLADCPVFIVGNGPSLDQLVDFIKANQEKAIVISCGSALGALYQYGITPDIHCEQERTSPIAEQLEYYCPQETLDELILWGPSTLHPDVYAKFPVKLMAPKGSEPSEPLLMESSLAHLFEIHNYINPTVANTATSIAVALGFNDIYLLGVDLAHKKGGVHHSAKSMYYSEEGEDLSLYDSNDVLENELEGNFGGIFHTDSFFGGSKRVLEWLIGNNTELSFKNLSDGALIKGAQPLRVEVAEIKTDIIEEKRKQLKALVTDSTYLDDGSYYQELAGELDTQGYEEFCLLLIKAIDELDDSFEGCLKLLKQHFMLLIDEDLCNREIFYYLLKGSVLHMQAMLIRLLYEAVEEADAIEDFKQALAHYREFLAKTIIYYKENALKPHYYETNWFAPLTKK